MKLEQSVLRAKENKQKLFAEYHVYISDLVAGYAALVNILEANGAMVTTISHKLIARAKILRRDALKIVDNHVLVCTESGEDKTVRDKFREEVKETEFKWGIYLSDWIMTSVLRQQIIEDAKPWAIKA